MQLKDITNRQWQMTLEDGIFKDNPFQIILVAVMSCIKEAAATYHLYDEQAQAVGPSSEPLESKRSEAICHLPAPAICTAVCNHSTSYFLTLRRTNNALFLLMTCLSVICLRLSLGLCTKLWRVWPGKAPPRIDQ